jgi:hypothetical protein
MTSMLREYLCLPPSFPQNILSTASCGESALFLTYCPASSFCSCLINCVYMCTVAALNTKYYLSYYYYYYYYYYYLLQLSFHSVAAVLTLVTNKNKYTYVGCPESVRTLKIARHCVDLARRGKCYSLVMSLTNCVAKTALLYLA